MNTGPQALEGEPTNRLLHFTYQGQSLGLSHYVSIKDQINIVKSHFGIPDAAVVSFFVKPDGLIESRIPESSWRFIGDPVNNRPQIFVRAPPVVNLIQSPVGAPAANTSVNPVTATPRRNIAHQSSPFGSTRFESPSAHVVSMERATFGPPNTANRHMVGNASTSSRPAPFQQNIDESTGDPALDPTQMDIDNDGIDTCDNNLENTGQRSPERQEAGSRPATPPQLGTNYHQTPAVKRKTSGVDHQLANRQSSKNAKLQSRRDSDEYMVTDEDPDQNEGHISDATSVENFWERGGRIVQFYSGKRNPVKCTECQARPGSICRKQRGQYALKCFECRRRQKHCSLKRYPGRTRDFGNTRIVRKSGEEPDTTEHVRSSEMANTEKRKRGRPRTVPFGPHLPRTKRPDYQRKEKTLVSSAVEIIHID